MATIRQCATCGAALTEGVPDGQCPECLIQLGLEAGVASAADSPDGGFFALPRTFGDYELLEEIARGGMGVVLKARQKSLDRLVAVKLILSGHFAGRDSIHRFRTEASAAAALQHPNIVAIHEVGVHQGEHYLAMDLVDGPNLAQFVKNTPLPAPLAARYLKAIAEAIHYAHERGILHRDLKPSNILIDANDQPRVTDFGLAKRLVGTRSTASETLAGMGSTPSVTSSEDRSDEVELVPTDLTLTGQVLGSPNYIAPEQASGKRGQVGRQSDVYSLGAILYHLLTGRGPFVSDTVAETLQQVLHEEPVSPRLLNPGVPRDLETICLKCMEKEPARRYATAQELADELSHFLKDEPILARPVSRIEKVWRWCRRKPALASLGAATILLLLAVAIGSPIAAYRINRSREQAVQAGRQTQRNLVAQYVANGTRLMNDGDLFMALLWYTEALQLDAGDAHREEPHRIRIASVLRQCPKLVNVALHGTKLFYSGFSPEGDQLITAGDDHTARVWNATGGAEVLRLNHDDEVNDARFSPDGRSILTASRDRTARLWDRRSGQLLHTLRHGELVWRASFSPDSRRVATACADGTAQVWDAATGRPEGLPLIHTNAVVRVDFSPDGRTLATCSIVNQGYLWDWAAGRIYFSHDHNGGFGGITFNPDSSRFIACDGHDVRVWEAQTLEEVPYSPLKLRHSATQISWGTGGRSIVAASRDGTAQAWNAETGAPFFTPAIHHDGEVLTAQISPDGRRVLSGGQDTVAQLHDCRSGRLCAVPLKFSLHVKGLAFNRDGRRLLGHSCDQAARIWDQASGDWPGPTRPSFENESRAISPDQQRLLWNGSSNDVWISDLQTQRRLATLPHEHGITYATFSRDGRTVLTSTEPNNPLSSMPNSMFLWDASSGRRLNDQPMIQPFFLMYAAFSRDSSRVLTCGFDYTARVWNARDGRAVSKSMRHRQKIHWGAFSPDGHDVVTASFDNTVRVWESETGLPLTPPLTHTTRPIGAAWSEDKRYLCTLTVDDRVQVWDLGMGDPLTPPRRAWDPAKFAPAEGAGVAPVSWTVLPRDDRPIEDLLRLARMLAVGRVDAGGNAVPVQVEELTTDWRWLRDRYPDQFRVSSTDAAAWHLREADDCEVGGDWAAAFFHIDQASAASPGDSSLRKRRDELASALKDPDGLAPRRVGLACHIPPRHVRSGLAQVDLSTSFNLALGDLGKVVTGNIPPEAKRYGLDALPTGLRTFCEVPFDVRGIVHLSGEKTQVMGMELPERMDGIKVGQKCRRLHFLQATSDWVQHGVQVGSYIVHYANGEQRELPIIYGRDTGRYVGRPRLSKAGEAVMIWPGGITSQLNNADVLRLFKSTRDNPLPDIEVVSVDFQSAMTDCAPFLIALTVE